MASGLPYELLLLLIWPQDVLLVSHPLPSLRVSTVPNTQWDSGQVMEAEVCSLQTGNGCHRERLVAGAPHVCSPTFKYYLSQACELKEPWRLQLFYKQEAGKGQGRGVCPKKAPFKVLLSWHSVSTMVRNKPFHFHITEILTLTF